MACGAGGVRSHSSAETSSIWAPAAPCLSPGRGDGSGSFGLDEREFPYGIWGPRVGVPGSRRVPHLSIGDLNATLTPSNEPCFWEIMATTGLDMSLKERTFPAFVFEFLNIFATCTCDYTLALLSCIILQHKMQSRCWVTINTPNSRALLVVVKH